MGTLLALRSMGKDGNKRKEKNRERVGLRPLTRTKQQFNITISRRYSVTVKYSIFCVILNTGFRMISYLFY